MQTKLTSAQLAHELTNATEDWTVIVQVTVLSKLHIMTSLQQLLTFFPTISKWKELLERKNTGYRHMVDT